MTRDEMMRVRVTEEEKQRYRDYADRDDNRYNSASHLLRAAALREINGGYVEDELEGVLEQSLNLDTDEIVRAVEIGLSDQTEQIETLSNQIADLEEMLMTNDEITELASEIREGWLLRLPRGMTPDDLDVTDHHIEDENQWVRLSGTPEDFAEVTGHEHQTVRRAFRRAKRIYPDVESKLNEDGIRRYWRVDDDVDVDDEIGLSDEERQEVIDELGEDSMEFVGGTDYEPGGFDD